MSTRKFKIICDGQFIGFIFISGNNSKFPNYIVATISPYERRGNWNEGDLELVGQRTITDIYDINTTVNEIQNDLLNRATINQGKCIDFQLINY
jgi:hypothetical protein